jgi:FRG domain
LNLKSPKYSSVGLVNFDLRGNVLTNPKPSKEIKSLPEYLEYLLKHCECNDDALFRGQSRDYPLLPKIARLKPRGDATHLEIEKKMLALIVRKSNSHLETLPTRDMDWLAVAQHHGMATRLLDWSCNPLTALWFAVESPAKPEMANAVVWIFFPSAKDFVKNVQSFKPLEIKATKVFAPNYLNRRIAAQQGWFTVHAIREDGKFLPLERNTAYKKRLTKICIPATKFSSIRADLDRCGINAETVFNDFDGLCKDAQWQHTQLADEDNP